MLILSLDKKIVLCVAFNQLMYSILMQSHGESEVYIAEVLHTESGPPSCG